MKTPQKSKVTSPACLLPRTSWLSTVRSPLHLSTWIPVSSPCLSGTLQRVYDLLVGHEVGHASIPPTSTGQRSRCPKDYVNVVEDSRIEKLMKRKYPGLSKTFFKGYQELDNQDSSRSMMKNWTTSPSSTVSIFTARLVPSPPCLSVMKSV